MPIDLKLNLVNKIKVIKLEEKSRSEFREQVRAETDRVLGEWNTRYVQSDIRKHVRKIIPNVYDRKEMEKHLVINYTVRRPTVDMESALRT